jgi:two-component system sensor histidine kinase/response regulator
VIALSANVMERDIELGREAGMDAHIGKPINIDRLLEMLVKYV